MNMELHTPHYNLQDFPDVYEPSEDTHLFLDALEQETDFIRKLNPLIALEVGSGSGILITALATILKNNCAYLATEINVSACLATRHTASMNSVAVQSVAMNLTSFLRCRYDVILFNPPYVVTEKREIAGNGLNRAYAGGNDGREIIDNFLETLPNILTEKGVCYMLILKENKIEEIEDFLGKFQLKTELVLERKIPGEWLFVFKFYR